MTPPPMSILFRDTCRSIRDKLPLHVGRDLEPKLEKRVDEHLASCLNCLREYRALAETRAILGVVAIGQFFAFDRKVHYK